MAIGPDFETEMIGRHGRLTVPMPTPVVLSAAKLVRCGDNDAGDIVWWIRRRRITLKQIEAAIDRLASPFRQEAARGNLVFVRPVAKDA
jgi:hypothetical protein